MQRIPSVGPKLLLGLFARDTAVLAACGAHAVRGLARTGKQPAAAGRLGQQAISSLEAEGHLLPLGLLAQTSEALQTAGDGGAADAVLAKGDAALDDDDEADLAQLGNFLFARDRRQFQAGDLDSAQATFERLCEVQAKRNDEHQYAVARGHIADILQARGELDEALRIRCKEIRPVFTRLGDVREVAVTQGKIADILSARGKLDEALRIHREEELPIYTQLGDVRELVVAQAKIADILEARGEPDKALRILREEALPVYTRLGDAQLVAVTQGRIALVLFRQGRFDEAVRLQEQRLATNRRLSDADGIAASLWDIAKIELRREQIEQATPRLAEAWEILQRAGQAEGTAVLGSTFGQILANMGRKDEAREVLGRSAAAYRKLGRNAEAEQVEALIRDMGSHR
jgi:tetratricopeptide (TPR) repeat protein